MTKHVIEPEKDGLVIEVGGPNADIGSFDSKGIQLAVDSVNLHGRGIVKLNEGIFKIAAPIQMRDNVILTGMGDKTVLRKIDGVKTSFITDADYGELMVMVKEASSFRLSMGIQVYDSISDGWSVSTAVITAIKGNAIYFDRHLIKDYEFDLGGTVSNACSIIEGVGVDNIKVSNLMIDGNDRTNDYINGCRGGAVYLLKARNCLVENIIVAGFNGDGISWQITEDIVIRNCEVRRCANYGIHPGTGSLRSVVEGCDIHDNSSDGLFVCWRVQNGVFRNNRFHNNGFNGINIGHKDTDNLFENNHIFSNAVNGIYLRPEKESNGAHRNIYKRNIIEDNGNSGTGYGVLIDSYVEDTAFEDNIIRDNGRCVQKAGIFIKQKAANLKLHNNTMTGHESVVFMDDTQNP